MKINELITLVNNKNKMLKGDQLLQFLNKSLEVKEYLSIKEKKNLIDDIINESIIYENGVFKFDEINKYIVFTMKTIEFYTNIELSDDIESDYDELCRAKLLNAVISTFNGEYENISLLLKMRCDYILSSNNIEEQFGKFLTGLLDKIDDVVNVLSNKIEDIDLKNFPVNLNDINKLIEFVNSQKK